jgi:hypothetical protein
MSTGWEEQLWYELDELSLIEQFETCAEWINTMSRELLPALAAHRRQVVLQILALPDWDVDRLAEETGTRRGAITRLKEEGRAGVRAEQKKATGAAA